MKIINATRKTSLAERAKIADSFFQRLKGLLFTEPLPLGQGLLLKPCSSIHTIGMIYSIDVLFIDIHGIVIKTVKTMKPCRLAACKDSTAVIELPAGTLEKTKTQIGDKIEFMDCKNVV